MMFIKLTFAFLSIFFLVSCNLNDNSLVGSIGAEDEASSPPAASPPPAPSVLKPEDTVISLSTSRSVKESRVTVTATTKDQYGNTFYDSGATVTFFNSGGVNDGWFSSAVVDNGDGTYEIDYFVEYNPSSSDIQFHAEISGTPSLTSDLLSINNNPRLAFTGNSLPSASIAARSFDENDSPAFTLTGNCDVELGDVTIRGSDTANVTAYTSTASCDSVGGGTFSHDLPYSVLSDSQGVVFVDIKQSTLQPVETWLYKTISASPPTILTTMAQVGAMTCGDTSVFYILGNSVDVTVEAGATNNFTRACSTGTGFSGIFDGNGFTLSRLHVSSVGGNQAIIAETDPGARLSNINIDTMVISSTSFTIGALIAMAYDSDLRNIHVTNGSIVSSFVIVGGIIGQVVFGPVNLYNVSFSGSVQGSQMVGGIVGQYFGTGSVARCAVSGSVTGTQSAGISNTGGVVGDVTAFADIQYCNVSANVSGFAYTGGIRGEMASGSITHNVYSGNVNGTTRVGGIIADTFGDSFGFEQNLMLGNITSSTSASGPIWGNNSSPSGSTTNALYDASLTCSSCDTMSAEKARTTAELQQRSTYEGWDFINVWKLDEGSSFPRFRWEP